MFVPAAATFAEMLESELNFTNVPRACAAWSRPITTPLFVFEPPRPVVPTGGVDLRSSVPPVTPTTGSRVAHAHTPLPESDSTSFTEPPTTRTVTLSVRDLRALAALNDLGADLGENLSPRTLRRAFRRLARRYHPDRHPGSSAADRQRLARLFADATEHYRVLTAALATHVSSP
jgi:hypothetical protein